MKSIAIAALLGSASAITMTRTNQDKLYDEVLLQTDKVLENLDPFTGFHTDLNGHPGT